MSKFSPRGRSPLFMAYAGLVLTALFWSGNFVLARAMHASIAPMTLSFGRWILALLILLPWGGPAAWAQRTLLWQHRWRLLLLALLGVSGFNSLVYWGLQTTTATNGVLLNSLIPILIALLGALFFKQALSQRQMAGVLISFVGVCVIVSQGDWQRALALQFNFGDVIILLAILAWAFYTLLLKGLPAEMNRLGLLTALVFLGLLAILPMFAAELWLGGWRTPFNGATVATFLYVGLFPSVLAFIFYNHGVRVVGAARAGAFIHLMPAFGALLSMLFLHEQLHLFHVFGLSAIFSGVWLSARGSVGASGSSD